MLPNSVFLGLVWAWAPLSTFTIARDASVSFAPCSLAHGGFSFGKLKAIINYRKTKCDRNRVGPKTKKRKLTLTAAHSHTHTQRPTNHHHYHTRLGAAPIGTLIQFSLVGCIFGGQKNTTDCLHSFSNAFKRTPLLVAPLPLSKHRSARYTPPTKKEPPSCINYYIVPSVARCWKTPGVGKRSSRKQCYTTCPLPVASEEPSNQKTLKFSPHGSTFSAIWHRFPNASWLKATVQRW